MVFALISILASVCFAYHPNFQTYAILYLAEPTAATLKGCGYALQQNLEKTKQTKTTIVQIMSGLKLMICLFGFFWISNLES